MEKAFNLLKLTFFLGFIIYSLGSILQEEFLLKIIKGAGEKLAPYGVEILHLR
jgi:hypothetical protein